ncbi:MAG: hypothetical protein DHS20C09_07620 [marine bacterium B5-7]|nr:MAG: hypothetical protein DHS20C09_07620 [marine bacterium B5-7]
MAIPQPKFKLQKGTVVPPDVPDIFSAAADNNLQALELALEHYDVNAQDESGLTPLHYAASTLAYLTLERLLDHPDIDATLCDNYGRSASTIAFECCGSLADPIIDKFLNPRCYPWLYPATEPS